MMPRSDRPTSLLGEPPASAWQPPRVLRTDLPPQPDVLLDHEWIKAHSEEYRGRWIALRRGELVAAALTGSELRRKLGSAKGLFVTRLY